MSTTNNSTGRRSRTALFILPGAGLLLVTAATVWSGTGVAGAEGDVMRGWRVFNEKRCVDCHAIWDQGGTLGPDLGRIRSRPLSVGQLAGVMWNHIPKMMARMKQVGLPPASLNDSEMADIFALVYFVRQLDEPGDPVRGQSILRNKGCTQCHSINTPEGTVGPDLAKWGSYANPIIWAQMMWEHAPMMEEAMKRSGISWPKLEGADLVHIVAYLRSAGLSGEKTYLYPGSAEQGRSLFHEKGCDNCHPGDGPNLAEVDLPTSVGALAARMWNHSPEMARVMHEQDVARQPMTAQELAHILTYVLTLGPQSRTGAPARGKQVFADKGCSQCHLATEGSTGPSFQQLNSYASPVSMAAAMWNHGETMLQRMTQAGMTWPVFSGNEMADLLAYVGATGKADEH
jgi:cytochrome c2